MESKYVDLFKELTRATAIAAEQVMDYDKEKNDDEGYEKAKTLRDDFEQLYDKLNAEDFDGILTKIEYARLLIGAYIITNNLHDKVKILKKSIDAYEKTLMPKLQTIVDADEENTQSVAEKVLILEDNK